MAQIGSYYNLTPYHPGILGGSYSNLMLKSILDYETALKFADILGIHRQIFPYLPEGTPADYTRYTYYLFKKGDKNLVIAHEWIVPSSLVETTGVSYTLRLNNISPEKYTVVRDQLRLLGISFDVLSN